MSVQACIPLGAKVACDEWYTSIPLCNVSHVYNVSQYTYALNEIWYITTELQGLSHRSSVCSTCAYTVYTM